MCPFGFVDIWNLWIIHEISGASDVIWEDFLDVSGVACSYVVELYFLLNPRRERDVGSNWGNPPDDI